MSLNPKNLHRFIQIVFQFVFCLSLMSCRSVFILRGQGKLTCSNHGIEFVSNFLPFFSFLPSSFYFFSPPRFSCSKNDQAVHKKLLPLSALDIYTLTHTHTLFTSGLVFNFTSKSGQEAPVQMKSCKREEKRESVERNEYTEKRKTLIHLLWKCMSQSSH